MILTLTFVGGKLDCEKNQMFLKLSHQDLNVYRISRNFVIESYQVANKFPTDEKFILAGQLKRAAVSAHSNVSEGSSRKSSRERNRFFEIARGSVVEVDAILDLAWDLNYLKNISLGDLPETTLSFFKILSKLIRYE